MCRLSFEEIILSVNVRKIMGKKSISDVLILLVFFPTRSPKPKDEVDNDIKHKKAFFMGFL